VTDEPLRVRAAVVRIVDHGTSTTVIGPHSARRFDGDSAALLRAVLDLHARPIGRDQLFADLAAGAGLDATTTAEPQAAPTDEPHVALGTDARAAPTAAALPTQPIDDLLALLVADGVLVTARETAAPLPVTQLRRVVLGISGAIAAADAPALIRGLQASGCDVRVALTRSAARLVSRAALDALTHHAVWTGLWQRDARLPVPHINLAEWAELVVVCPASATTLSRIATGDCSDLVAAIVAATRAPVVVVPSMNDAMYGSPAVQANLATLRDHGRRVVHPALGSEVAHPPHARAALLGPAPPTGAVVDIVRHLLRELATRPRVPDSAQAWEQLWSTTHAAQLPWHAAALEPALAEAIAARHAPGRRLLDVGTGDGLVAIAAAHAGFRVTAIDVAPSALGRACERADRAGARSIVFVLDDITAPRLDGAHDIAVDRGLLHALPHERRRAYATGVTRLISPRGTLIVVAHEAGSGLGTLPIAAADLGALLPAFELVRTSRTTLGNVPAEQFELERRTG
jgi:3-polyprenyl-4-hydroxybenzoate decarboxylase/SAM-dependent methyltransferase